MKALVTAVHGDGAQWGWPGEAVFRYRGEDGSWAWVPQLPRLHHAVGDVIDVEDGWEWLDDDEREAEIAAHDRMTSRERREALLGAETRQRHATKKPRATRAQIQREIDAILAHGRKRSAKGGG